LPPGPLLQTRRLRLVASSLEHIEAELQGAASIGRCWTPPFPAAGLRANTIAMHWSTFVAASRRVVPRRLAGMGGTYLRPMRKVSAIHSLRRRDILGRHRRARSKSAFRLSPRLAVVATLLRLRRRWSPMHSINPEFRSSMHAQPTPMCPRHAFFSGADSPRGSGSRTGDRGISNSKDLLLMERDPHNFQEASCLTSQRWYQRRSWPRGISSRAG